MKLLLIVLSSLITFWSCSPKDATNEPEQENPSPITKPNILLVIADDMGVDATPGFELGSVKPSMPNLESLMQSGLTFTNVWSYAVCSPTRASILTGKYGFRTGVTGVGQELSSSETSLQKYLDTNNSGYANALIGKWHLSNNVEHPSTLGIGTFKGILRGAVTSYWDWDLVENGQSQNVTDYATSKLTDLAIDWIDNQTQPWFLWMAYNAPHAPFHLPDSDLHHQGNLPTDQTSIDTNPLPYYMAMLEAMDTEMGRLLNSMSQEERDNTVIIFIGDNGTPNQVVQDYPKRHAKNSIYEGGIRVPMVVSGYGVERNGQEDALVNSTDLFSSIAAIAGIDVDEMNDSKSFTPLLTNSNSTFRDIAFAELDNGSGEIDYAVRDHTYKYILFADGSEAFYNLVSDPLESTNRLNPAQSALSEVESSAKSKLETALNTIRQ